MDYITGKNGCPDHRFEIIEFDTGYLELCSSCGTQKDENPSIIDATNQLKGYLSTESSLSLYDKRCIKTVLNLIKRVIIKS